MSQKKDMPILVDFYALGCTGKTTHSKGLYNYLLAKGFKVEVLSYTVLRNDEKGASPKTRVSILLKSIAMGFAFLKCSFKASKITNIFYFIKWSHRLLNYTTHIKSYETSNIDFLILDPSLSSKLKKFYKYFDDDTFAKALSHLEKNRFLSDVVVFIEADIDIVMERRQMRVSHTKTKQDSATFSVKKAYGILEEHKSTTDFLTVNYNDFSSLDSNIQRIGKLCIESLNSKL
jgi:thymidylate kinase